MRPIVIRAAVTLVAAAAAAVPTVASATNTGNKGRALSFGANTAGPPVSGRIPSSLVFSAPGFKLDLKAIAKRCTHEQAVLNECASKSRLGVGHLTIHVVTPKFTRNTTIPINVYLESSKSVLAVAFVGGPHVIPATISTSGGITLSFNALPPPPPFPSTTLSLDGVSIKLGATRMVIKRTHSRVHGKRKTTIKRTRSYLIHDPANCSGPQPTSIAMGFRDGTHLTLTTHVGC